MLRKYTTRLTEDQIRFLKDLPNASQWLREQINRGIVETTAKPWERVILLNKRLRELENKLDQIYDDREYEEVSKALSDYEEAKKFLEIVEALANLNDNVGAEPKYDDIRNPHIIIFDRSNPEVKLMLKEKERERFHYVISISPEKIGQAFLYAISPKHDEATKKIAEIETQLASLRKVQEAYETMVKDVEGQIAEVKKEIEATQLSGQSP